MPAEAQSNNVTYWSVAETVKKLNLVLERGLPQIQVQGEIYQVSRASSGHLYFSLKDAQAQVQAVMWKGVADTLDFKVEPGISVLCHGKPNVYQGSGKLQLVVHRMLQAGEGLLMKKFLELKARLEKEGYFNPGRKRSLPFFPTSIGVVTSGTGAVIHDIMVKIRERMPSLKVYLTDVRVQGEGAAQEIANGIRTLSESGLVEVIIVARGGGSLQDLWAFNEEPVVKAIFASSVPVVSGVGHEVDVTLSDFVADVRAPTPTAAAEMVVPKRSDLLLRISELERRFFDIERWFQILVQRVDECEMKFTHRVQNLLQQAGLRLKTAEARLQSIEPGQLLQSLGARVNLLAQKLQSSSARQLGNLKLHLDRLSATLEAVSPLRVLERGFSVVQHKGKLVKSVSAVSSGDDISVRMADGALMAKVK